MPIYEVKAPDGSILEVQGPENASDAQLINTAAAYYREKEFAKAAPPEEPVAGPKAAEDVGFFEGIGAATRRGLSSFGDIGSGIGLATEHLTGSEAETRRKMQAIKADQRKAEMTPGMTFEKLQQLYGKEGALEVLSQMPKYIVEQILQSAPQMATPLAATAVTSPFLTPIGGAAVGVGVYALQQFGNFMVRQAQEKDDPKELEVAKAAMTAAGTAPLGYFADRFTFGLGSIGKNAGKEAVEELAARTMTGTVTNAAKKIGGGVVSGVIAEAPTEVLEQVAERYQAGLDLTGKDAEKEYLEAFFGAAAAGGGIKGVSSTIDVMRGRRGEVAPEEPTGVEPTIDPVTGQPVQPEGMTEGERIREEERRREEAAGIAPVEPVVQPTPEPTVEPVVAEPVVEPTPQPQTQPLNTAALVKEFINEQGHVDYAAFGNALGQSVTNLIKNGSTITAYVNDEPHIIVGNDGEFLVDDQGNKISPVNFGGFANESNRIEFTPTEEVVTEPEVTPAPEETDTTETPPEAETKAPFGVHPVEEVDLKEGDEQRNEERRAARAEAGLAGINYSYDANGRIDPNASTLSWDIVERSRNGKQLLDAMYDYVPMDFRPIIDRIKKSVANVGVSVDYDPKTAAKGQSGVYKPGLHRVEFSYHMKDGSSFETITHELVHGATVNNYYQGKRGDPQYAAAAKEMDKLARFLTKNYANRNNALWFLLPHNQGGYRLEHHGMELIARAMTSRKVQQELKNITISGKTTGFTKFVTNVRKLLGLPQRDNSALTKILDLSEQIMEPQRGGRKATVARGTQEEIAQIQKPIENPEFTDDNPGGDWLAGKQRDFREGGRDQYGVPKRMGPVTGAFRKRVLIPVEKLAEVPGMRGEQRNVRSDSLSWLVDHMGETGKLPLYDGKEYSPFIQVDASGQPWVNEGNHRIMAAKQLGWKYLPVEVRYFSGGEQSAGDWSPESLMKDHAELAGTSRFEEEIPSIQSQEPTPVQSPQTTQHRTITGAMPQESDWGIAEPSGKMPWSRHSDDLVYNFFDKHVDMKRVIQAINKTKNKLDEMWDAYRRETLYHNRAARMTEQFMKNELKPLAQEMVDKNVTEEEVNNYLLARFAEERNNEINLRNDQAKPIIRNGQEVPGPLQNRGSGVHTLIARAYLSGIDTAQANMIRDFMAQNGLQINNNENKLLDEAVRLNDTKRKNLKDLAAKVDRIIAKTQEISVNGGLEKAATIESWRRRYPNYVPLRRNPDEMDFVEKNYGTGQGFSTRAGMGKAATGSLKTVDNILSNIILQRDMAITRAEKGRIGRALYAMFLQHPNPKFALAVNPTASVISKANDLAIDIQKDVDSWKMINERVKQDKAAGRQVSEEDLKQLQDLADRIKGKKARYADLSQQADRAKAAIRAELAGLEGEFGIDPATMDNLIREPQGSFYNPATGRVEYRTNAYLRNSPNVLAVPIDGETRYIFFNAADPRAKRMVASLKNADLDKLGVITGTVGKYTRWISMVNTQYNPFFGIYNMIRDVQGAQFSLSSTPLAGKQMAVNSHIIGSVKTIMRSLRSERKGGEAKGEYAKDWQEFQDRGGPTGMKDMLIRRHDKLSVLAEEMRKMQESGAKKIGRKAFGTMADLMSDFNDTMENAVRLSAFIEAKKKFKAQGMSEDVAGDKAAELAKNLTVNFNRKGAKSQLINSWFAFFNAAAQGTARLYETLTGPAGKKIMASLVLMGVIQQLVLSSSFKDDDPPEFVREKNLIFPTGDGKYISWPMPLGFNFLVNIGRIMTAAVEDRGNNISKHMYDMAGMMSNTFNPFGSSGLSMQTAAPTIADPFLAIEANKDAFGRPIYREDMASKPVPGYRRSRESATTVSKFIAEVLNRVSGGTEFQKGEISPTGDEIDYLAGQLGGGVWREGKKVAELVSSAGTGEELPPYRVPLAGRFYGDTGSAASVKNKFYQNVAQLSKYEEEIKGRGPKGTVQEFLKEHPEARMYAAANTMENEVSALNKMRKQLIEKGASPQRLKQLEETKVRLMRQFNEKYEKAMPR
jgi:hypothetical protein